MQTTIDGSNRKRTWVGLYLIASGLTVLIAGVARSGEFGYFDLKDPQGLPAVISAGPGLPATEVDGELSEEEIIQRLEGIKKELEELAEFCLPMLEEAAEVKAAYLDPATEPFKKAADRLSDRAQAASQKLTRLTGKIQRLKVELPTKRPGEKVYEALLSLRAPNKKTVEAINEANKTIQNMGHRTDTLDQAILLGSFGVLGIRHTDFVVAVSEFAAKVSPKRN